MFPIAGSIFTGIGAVPLISKILVGDAGSWVKVCVDAGVVVGVAQETKTSRTIGNNFVYFILITF